MSLPLPVTDRGSERLLQFIWRFGSFNSANLTTCEGETNSILFPGTHTKTSGPDFTGARTRIGETTFFGSVELHMKTSDWQKHRHRADRNDTNVILHVVFQYA